MKIIEAMKKLKDLNVKSVDLINKVRANCSQLNIESPVYPDTKTEVKGWIQAHHDLQKEIESLRLQIQYTNLFRSVSIEIEGTVVKKSIAAWIHRRRDLAKAELDMWSALGDRNLKEQNLQTTPGGPTTEIRIIRYFEPKERDQKVSEYRSEPHLIDGALEVANATIDLMDPGDPF